MSFVDIAKKEKEREGGGKKRRRGKVNKRIAKWAKRGTAISNKIRTNLSNYSCIPFFFYPFSSNEISNYICTKYTTCIPFFEKISVSKIDKGNMHNLHACLSIFFFFFLFSNIRIF